MVLGDAAHAADPRFSTGPARYANREATHRLIEEAFSKLTAAQVIERLEAADIANARLNTMEEFWSHPQLAARGRWREVGSPAGRLQALLPPFNLSDFEPKMEALPGLGEHSAELLAELGYGEDEIATFAASGMITLWGG